MSMIQENRKSGIKFVLVVVGNTLHKVNAKTHCKRQQVITKEFHCEELFIFASIVFKMFILCTF